MADYIVRGMAADNQIRVFAATTKKLVEDARQAHNTSPVATAALGRLLTAGAMMGSMCKGEKDMLTLQIQCSGPIQGLTVTADAAANVKGYAYNPNVMLPPSDKGKLDVGKALDLGVLSVIKDMGLKEPYMGQTQLVSGEIAEDLTYYFATSEQVPSAVALGVLMNKDNTVKQAGGFIIQLMPFAEDGLAEKLEGKLSKITSITSLLEQDMTPEDIIHQVLGDFGVEITDNISTRFYCNCCKERVEKAIVSVGSAELRSMIADNKPIEVNCHFCNKKYTFDIEELKEILRKSKR
ncbi:MAG: Hsp33 family molecular chaperone HslO [Lachnospiraceae bacterium]|nr:Hsp33 family molecular chaperone HslO [Lachnospiraceae bacterium]